MNQEIDVLLRTILYQVKISKSLEEAEMAIRVMCSKDVIAAVEQQANEYKTKKD